MFDDGMFHSKMCYVNILAWNGTEIFDRARIIRTRNRNIWHGMARHGTSLINVRSCKNAYQQPGQANLFSMQPQQLTTRQNIQEKIPAQQSFIDTSQYLMLHVQHLDPFAKACLQNMPSSCRHGRHTDKASWSWIGDWGVEGKGKGKTHLGQRRKGKAADRRFSPRSH